MKAAPVIHEPIMKVAVETPTEFQGGVMGSLEPAPRHDRRFPGRGAHVRHRIPGSPG
jgi:hypothetical protein